MKQILVIFLLILVTVPSGAQLNIREKKYPSLLWEITGNGTRKPSYLIGTMHVSSKLAFNLPDSFYIAMKNAQVVALETNPETWQEDMSKYDLDGSEYYGGLHNYTAMPDEYLRQSTLKFYKYDTKIERALYSNPSTINNLLYRTYGNETSDFEEDTYLDMYIYQCGKKWGKQVAGVENYGESMKLMAEAYRDAANDKNRKQRSYGSFEEDYSLEKLQEAYRMGNLDLLDTINKYNSVSGAFDEKFLYERNRIQAVSIDSILKSGSTLFVGVGAAHLPGDRGVIEMLRSRGYKLRPIKMGQRASRQKDIVDKIRVPVIFQTATAPDGLYKVDIPGKFYKFGDDPALNQQQCADMANGSYYMVTRIMTNAWMWNHSPDLVYKAVDSLLYENVPGKIISRAPITKNGYRGFDIINRTRRGDLQRYNIFITPFEVLFFKMSGNGDYISNSDEAKRFFGSIQLKEYSGKPDPAITGWKKYVPPFGGFSVDLPHDPYVGNDGSWIFDAADKTGVQYRIIRTDIHNYGFAEEDSFDLRLMEESFSASEFIDAPLDRRHLNHLGYPALESSYKDKQGALYTARFIIQGPHYYTLITHGKEASPAMKKFMESFMFTPFVYRAPKLNTDTSLYYTVKTPVYPEEKKISLGIPRFDYFGYGQTDEESEEDLLEAGAFRSNIVSNDSTGEKIFISFFRSPRYYYTKDSSMLEKKQVSYMGDTSWIVRKREMNTLPNGIRTWETVISDTGSSRTIWGKTYYKDGITFTLTTQSDTLTAPSDFVKTFYATFMPSDTLKGINPFVKKTALFFADFRSPDSLLHKRAVKHIRAIDLDAEDLPGLKDIMASLSWKEKKYLDTREALINKLGAIPIKAAADYLKQLYYALDDTIQLQYPVLENLLKHKTPYSYRVFRDIVMTEPPVLDFSTQNDYGTGNNSIVDIYRGGYSYRDGKFLDELYDTLALTRTILPELLPLLNLDDYKFSMMDLLGKMVDSQLVKPADYEMYFTKFLIEAKQELKKQSIAEKKKAIAKAEENKLDKPDLLFTLNTGDNDAGNENLSLYAVLLEPYWELNAAVQPLLGQMLASADKRLKYRTLLLLIRNNRPYPDTLLDYFAGLDEYRYELYRDLKKIKMFNRFPVKYNNHLDLGKSSLLDRKSYDKPDSVLYIDRLKTKYKDKEGFVYFFRYKEKKDDLTWKLAVAGLVPEQPGEFEFQDTVRVNVPKEMYRLFNFEDYNRYDFTGFSETKIREDESITGQLEKELKKILYSLRKSGKSFYGGNDNGIADSIHVD